MNIVFFAKPYVCFPIYNLLIQRFNDVLFALSITFWFAYRLKTTQQIESTVPRSKILCRKISMQCFLDIIIYHT